MGVIHVRCNRTYDAIISFITSITIIEYEWDQYKRKYMKYGLEENDLLIDQEYSKMARIVFDRAFNLCECLSQFMMY